MGKEKQFNDVKISYNDGGGYPFREEHLLRHLPLSVL